MGVYSKGKACNAATHMDIAQQLQLPHLQVFYQQAGACSRCCLCQQHLLLLLCARPHTVACTGGRERQ